MPSRTGVNNVVGGSIAQIGINVLNGDGMIGLIRTTRSSNGVIEDWGAQGYLGRGDEAGGGERLTVR
jgi:hypothetical protein